MDFLKTQFNHISQQLSALTATQRLLAGSLVVIIVMTLFWWTRYAGQAEMEAVLDQAFGPDDVRRVTLQLQSRGIKYKVQGDRILVPVDRKSEVLADLAYAQLLPRDTKTGIDEIIKNSSPWMSASEKKELWNKYKEMALAQVIRDFPGVSNAMVIIDAGHRPENPIGGVQPSATVNITMRSGQKADSRLVNAAADWVSGSVASMSKNRVKVIVDGVSHTLAADDGSGGGAWLDETRDAERYFATKLSEHLRWIDGAMVSVRVVSNRKRTETEEHKIDPSRKIIAPTEEESTSEETRSANRPGAEAGAGSNIPMGLGSDSSGGDATSATVEKTRAKNVVDYERSRVKQFDPGGTGTITGASIFIPRSRFARILQQRNPSAQNPDDAALQPLIDAELPSIRASVKACLGLDDRAVSVAAYTDLMPTVTAPPPAAATSVSLLVGGHVKEIAIGALAVISLFIVSMMVRKGSPAPVVAPAAAAAKPPQALGGNEELAGEAAEGSALLDGMELDEDTVRTQQVIEQVATLVKDNPDAAAGLVKRWLNHA